MLELDRHFKRNKYVRVGCKIQISCVYHPKQSASFSPHFFRSIDEKKKKKRRIQKYFLSRKQYPHKKKTPYGSKCVSINGLHWLYQNRSNFEQFGWGTILPKRRIDSASCFIVVITLDLLEKVSLKWKGVSPLAEYVVACALAMARWSSFTLTSSKYSNFGKLPITYILQLNMDNLNGIPATVNDHIFFRLFFPLLPIILTCNHYFQVAIHHWTMNAHQDCPSETVAVYLAYKC